MSQVYLTLLFCSKFHIYEGLSSLSLSLSKLETYSEVVNTSAFLVERSSKEL